MLVPTYRLTRPSIDPRLAPAVFAAVVLYLFELVRQSLGGALLVSSPCSCWRAWPGSPCWSSLRRRTLATGHRPVTGKRSCPIGPVVDQGARTGSVTGLLAAVFGYTRLARLTTPVALYGNVLALSLFAFVRVMAERSPARCDPGRCAS